MQHLTAEALARLVDEPSDRAEAAHLEACPACREELDALRRQTAALATLAQAPAAEPPAEQWAGIVAGQAAPAGTDAALDDLAVRRLTKRRTVPWFRIAAAVAIYAVGTATGVAMAGHSPAAGTPAAAPLATTSPAAPSQHLASAPDAAAAISPAAPAGIEAGGPEDEQPGSAQFASAPDAGKTPRLRPVPDASTPEEALGALRIADRNYAQAYSRVAALADTQQADDPAVRIAALESIVLTTR